MDLEKIKAKRDEQALEFRYAQQTAKIVTAINKQTKAMTDKFDELIKALKEEDTEESPPETLTS
jgi:hypothetical protein